MLKDINIQQITPLIHFQVHSIRDAKRGKTKEQAFDATLRASELKPKIDKFISNDLVNVNKQLYEKYSEVINNNFTKEILNQKGNSQYKIRIISTKNNINTAKKNGAYFGTAGNTKTENLTISIFSYNSKIKELVGDVIPYVLVLNNFGARQSKGFGGFIPKGMNEFDFEMILKSKYENVYKKELKTGVVEDVIRDDYQLLRSGINGKEYKKSLLMEYFYNEDTSWDKRHIKQGLKIKYPKRFSLVEGKNNKIPIKQMKNMVFARAVLGLAPNNTYREVMKDGKLNFSKQAKNITVSIEDVEGKIKRFKSPILFKIFNNNIYVVCNSDSLKHILDKEFVFKAKLEDEYEICKLKTPTKEQFDIDKFLKWALQRKEMGYKLLDVKGGK